MRSPGSLPVDEILPELLAVLGDSPCAVLSAPPGAGKTTRVPPSMLQAPWMQGKVCLMLEPRRLAAVRAARYMAGQLGEQVGSTVGYTIRGESRIGAATRVHVVTEGILTRMLHDAPDLPGVGAVIFDEFHERSIHADLGLALALDVQAHLRADLRILVMSATLDGVAVARLLGEAPVISCSGRMFPLETRFRQFPPEGPVESLVAQAVVRSLEHDDGDVLVFLPGRREIRRTEQLLLDARLSGVDVHTLYGDTPPDVQHGALRPAPEGRRKVILATSIAETSLTIDGVRIVVDSGLARGPRFDPRRGMAGLVTGPVSRATADQRRGRAARQGPGVCYRLWTEDQHAALPDFPTPEILVTDLAPLALDLALWGSPDAGNLRFLDPPPPAHLEQARALLRTLGALDAAGGLTTHGRAMGQLPVHPRLSHMILRGKEMGLGVQACEIAAILEEREILRSDVRSLDIESRLHALHDGLDADEDVRERAKREALRLCRSAGLNERRLNVFRAGILVALAYPDRIARRRGDARGRYLLASGTGASVPEWSPLSREEFLAVAEVDGVGTEARVFLAAPLVKKDVVDAFADSIVEADDIRWSESEHAVVARHTEQLGAIVLAERPIPPRGEAIRAAMLDGVRRLGLDVLPWEAQSIALRSRSEWLRLQRLVPDGWPDLSDQTLAATVGIWLAPFVEGMVRREHLSRLRMTDVLRSLFSATQLRELERLAPATVTVPTGSKIRLEYGTGVQPALSVRLQEMFGQTETPTVAGGKITVLLHLLSPAGRPLAVTQDLPSFWKNTYREVRRAMQARYPKHHWPEDPLHAPPTRKTRRS